MSYSLHLQHPAQWVFLRGSFTPDMLPSPAPQLCLPLLRWEQQEAEVAAQRGGLCTGSLLSWLGGTTENWGASTLRGRTAWGLGPEDWGRSCTELSGAANSSKSAAWTDEIKMKLQEETIQRSSVHYSKQIRTTQMPFERKMDTWGQNLSMEYCTAMKLKKKQPLCTIVCVNLNMMLSEKVNLRRSYITRCLFIKITNSSNQQCIA